MKRKFQLIILLSCFFVHSFGQYNSGDVTQIQTTSPTLSELGKYVDVPVGLYSGIPSISIPLYNIKTGSYNLPISLSYHAGGIKVQQRSSWVGLGWSLNAGGVITRVINGKADDKNHSIYSHDGQTTVLDQVGILFGKEEDNSTTNSYFEYDHESDYYYFNFCGYSGKFFFDKDGNVHMEEDKPYDITFSPTVAELRANPSSYDEGINQFKIKTEDGITYTFDKKETRINVPTAPNIVDAPYFDLATQGANGLGFCLDTDYINSYKDVMAWYLTKIEFPNNDKIITFTYNSIKYSDLERSGQVRKFGGTTPYSRTKAREQTARPCWHHYLYYNYSLSLIDGYQLSGINWENGSLTFNTDNSHRLDVDSSTYYQNTSCNPTFVEDYDGLEKRLKEIILKNRDGQDIKYYNLRHNYFESPGKDEIIYISPKWDKKHLYYRLRLDSVNESTPSGEVKSTYSFDYNTTNTLPHRYSNAVDFWGYYNGKESNEHQVPSVYIYPQVYFNKVTSGKMEAGGIDTTLFRSIYFPFKVPRYDNGPKTVWYDEGSNNSFEIGNLKHIISMKDTILMYRDTLFIDPNTSSTDNHITILGADRYAAGGDTNQVFMLNKITYPTGGFTEFTYEPNSFRLENASLSNDTMIGGGVRIKKIDFYDPIKNSTISKNFTYCDEYGTNSGRILDFPLFTTSNFDAMGNFNENDDLTLYDYNRGLYSSLSYPKRYVIDNFVNNLSVTTGDLTWLNLYLFTINPENLIMFSGSKNELGTTKGNYVAYEHVNIDYNGNGWEENTYSIPGTMNNRSDTIFTNNGVNLISWAGLNIGETTDYFPFPPNLNTDWNRGQLLTKKIFDNSGNIVKEIKNNYTISHYDTINQIRVSSNNSSISYNECVLEYKMLSAWKYLSRTEEISYYNPIHSSINVNTVTQFEQNDERLLSKKITTNSDGKQFETRIKYPKDYMNDLPTSIQYDIYDDEVIGLRTMIDSNMLNSPIETINLVDSKVTSGSINTYKLDAYDNIVPYTKLNLETTSLQLVDSNDESGDSQKFNNSHVQYDDHDNAEWTFVEDNLYPDDSNPNLKYTFNSSGNIIQVDKQNDNSTSFVWGYNNTLPTAKVDNAIQGSFIFENFESELNTSWLNFSCDNNDWIYSSNEKHSGDYSIKFIDENDYRGFYYDLDISKINLSDKYKYSTWVKVNTSTGSKAPRILVYIRYNNGSSSVYTGEKYAQNTGSWEYIESTIDLSNYSNITQFRIYLLNGGYSSTGAPYCEVYFDDVRLHPSGAQMTTYTHDPLKGITSESDQRNVPVHYKFDDFGRLIKILDQNRNVLKQYDYHYYND